MQRVSQNITPCENFTLTCIMPLVRYQKKTRNGGPMCDVSHNNFAFLVGVNLHLLRDYLVAVLVILIRCRPRQEAITGLTYCYSQ